MGKETQHVWMDEILLAVEPRTVDAVTCNCVSVRLPGVTLRFSFEDAETLGEALITMVRRAEEMTT